MILASIALAALIPQSIKDSVLLPPNDLVPLKEPQVAIDSKRQIFVAFGLGDGIRIDRSTDFGKSFVERSSIYMPDKKLALGMRRGPRICALPGRLVISAVMGSKGKGQDGDILAFTSTDNGETWSKPAKVNDSEGSAREGLHTMASSNDGLLACAWLDLRSKGTKLYASTSKDGGKSWSSNVLAYESPSGTICQCCHPTALFDSKGKLYLMFRNVIDGNRDMYLVSSADGGKSFSAASKLGDGAWALDACPMDGGMAAFSGNTMETIWRRKDTLYLCRPERSEKVLSDGKQGWIAAGVDGFYRVFMSDHAISYVGPWGGEVKLDIGLDDPVVAASPDGKLVVAAWAGERIRAAVLRSP